VECVYCGQCASVCPTGALTVKTQTDLVWNAIHDSEKKVVIQIAPAVRTAIAQEFSIPGGEHAMGKLVTALRRMGVDKVYDTSFAADLTTIEEATEFLDRVAEGEKLPQFTSCCPAWVKFAEQFASDYLSNLSSCKSPQQMFGSLLKKSLAEEYSVSREDVFVVSVMPCTAKKFEASRPEFAVDGDPDVNVVLSTQELIKMIGQSGLKLAELAPQSMDLPFGFKTGAGVIFGASGGVAEAVLRLAAASKGADPTSLDFHEVRGLDGLKEATVELDGKELRLAVISGLANAKELLEKLRAGEVEYDIIEVMACRGGCIGGGGQPLPNDMDAREARKALIYDCDAVQPLHNAADNPYVKDLYAKLLEKPNSEVAHELLHTGYRPRRRIDGQPVEVATAPAEEKVPVSVCVGTNCYLRGSYDTLKRLISLAKEAGVDDKLDFNATFCFENCKASPNVQVGDQLHGSVSPDNAEEFFNNTIKPVVDSQD
jgi:NADH-quinone oxidoreductase subunit G